MNRHSQEEEGGFCRQAVGHWFKALKAVGFTGIDNSTKPKLSLSASRTLPISKDGVLGIAFQRPKTIESLVHLVLCFVILEDGIRAVRWLRCAWFGEQFGRDGIRRCITESGIVAVSEISYGGGQEVFDAILKNSPDYSTIKAHFAGLDYGWD